MADTALGTIVTSAPVHNGHKREKISSPPSGDVARAKQRTKYYTVQIPGQKPCLLTVTAQSKDVVRVPGELDVFQEQSVSLLSVQSSGGHTGYRTDQQVETTI